MFNFPGYHWHFEISTKCALRCPRCPRTRLKGHYSVGQLEIDDIRRICGQPEFSEEALKITLCGGQGDPIYHSDFLEVVKYLKSFSVPKILTIVTNGSHKNEKWWHELKNLLHVGDDVVFSVDGYDQESNNLYRVNSDWASIISGMKTMAGGPAMVIWNAIYFKFNQDHIGRMMEMAQENGADGFRVTKSELFGSRHPDLIDLKIGYDPLEPDPGKISQNDRMYKTMHWFDQKSERFKSFGRPYRQFNSTRAKRVREVWENKLLQKFLPNCLFGFRGNYVDVDGYFYPCSWVSHPNAHFSGSSYRKRILKDDLGRFNLKKRPLKEILEDPVWQTLFSSWITENGEPLSECGQKCERQKFPQETYESYLRLGSEGK